MVLYMHTYEQDYGCDYDDDYCYHHHHHHSAHIEIVGTCLVVSFVFYHNSAP